MAKATASQAEHRRKGVYCWLLFPATTDNGQPEARRAMLGPMHISWALRPRQSGRLNIEMCGDVSR
jgi:hypothetical protein